MKELKKMTSTSLKKEDNIKIYGNFECSDNQLTSLENPNEIIVSTYKTQSGIELKDKEKLDQIAFEIFEEVQKVDPKSEEERLLLEKISSIGNADLKKFSNLNNYFLNSLMGESTVDSSQLMDDFKSMVELLSPYKNKSQGFISLLKTSFHKLMNKELSKDDLNNIIEKMTIMLYTTQNNLLRKNATIEVEKEEMDVFINIIEEHLYVVKKLDTLISDYAQKQSPAFKEHLTNTFDFTAKQKHIDIATSFGVNIQTYLSLDVILKQNQQIINWIKKTSTIHLEALKTALVYQDLQQFSQKASEFINTSDEFINHELTDFVNESKKIKTEKSSMNLEEKRNNIKNIVETNSDISTPSNKKKLLYRK